MIYEALIAPAEAPITSLDIKRALLTYDKILLVSPEDRELIPPNAYISATLGFPFFFGANIGPVRPLGKLPNYDEEFAATLDEFSEVRRQGLLEVVSTFNPAEIPYLTIGAVPLGGYPLNPAAVLNIYETAVENQEFLRAAIAHDAAALTRDPDILSALAIQGRADARINGLPPFPLFDGPLLSDATREPLTLIARSRIATAIKTAGYCEAKNLIPLFGTSYSRIIDRFLLNAQRALDFEDEDQQWRKRSHVLNLCHREFLGDARLAAMSMQEVLKFRTKAWGRQAEAREHLFEAVRQIALQKTDGPWSERNAEVLISAYREKADEVEGERKDLNFKIRCDMYTGFTGIIGAGLAAMDTLLQMQSAWSSVALTLGLGATLWSIDKLREHGPEVRKLKEKEADFARGAGFSIKGFYET